MEEKYLEYIKNIGKKKYKDFDSFYESNEFNKIVDEEIQRKIFYYYALRFSALENKDIKELYNDLENILKKIQSKDYLKICDEDFYITIINNYLEKIEIFNAEKEFYHDKDHIIIIRDIIKLFKKHYKKKECPIEVFQNLQDFYEIILIKKKHKIPNGYINQIERHLKEYKSLLGYLNDKIYNKNKIIENKKQINEENNKNKINIINENKFENINSINNNYLNDNKNIKNFNKQMNQNININMNNNINNNLNINNNAHKNQNDFNNLDVGININNKIIPEKIDINNFDNNINIDYNINNNNINNNNLDNNNKNNKELYNKKKFFSNFGDFSNNDELENYSFINNLLGLDKNSKINQEKNKENKIEKFKIEEKRYTNFISEKKDMGNNHTINPFKKEKEKEKSINNNKNKKKLKKKKIKEKKEEEYNYFLSSTKDIDINKL